MKCLLSNFVFVVALFLVSPPLSLILFVWLLVYPALKRKAKHRRHRESVKSRALKTERSRVTEDTEFSAEKLAEMNDKESSMVGYRQFRDELINDTNYKIWL